MFRNSKCPIKLDGAKIENLDFLEEILKNQLKVRKHAPQKFAILSNFSINISSFRLIFCPKCHF